MARKKQDLVAELNATNRARAVIDAFVKAVEFTNDEIDPDLLLVEIERWSLFTLANIRLLTEAIHRTRKKNPQSDASRALLRAGLNALLKNHCPVFIKPTHEVVFRKSGSQVDNLPEEVRALVARGWQPELVQSQTGARPARKHLREFKKTAPQPKSSWFVSDDYTVRGASWIEDHRGRRALSEVRATGKRMPIRDKDVEQKFKDRKGFKIREMPQAPGGLILPEGIVADEVEDAEVNLTDVRDKRPRHFHIRWKNLDSMPKPQSKLLMVLTPTDIVTSEYGGTNLISPLGHFLFSKSDIFRRPDRWACLVQFRICDKVGSYIPVDLDGRPRRTTQKDFIRALSPKAREPRRDQLDKTVTNAQLRRGTFAGADSKTLRFIPFVPALLNLTSRDRKECGQIWSAIEYEWLLKTGLRSKSVSPFTQIILGATKKVRAATPRKKGADRNEIALNSVRETISELARVKHLEQQRNPSLRAERKLRGVKIDKDAPIEFNDRIEKISPRNLLQRDRKRNQRRNRLK